MHTFQNTFQNICFQKKDFYSLKICQANFKNNVYSGIVFLHFVYIWLSIAKSNSNSRGTNLLLRK